MNCKCQGIIHKLKRFDVFVSHLSKNEIDSYNGNKFDMLILLTGVPLPGEEQGHVA